ncbi:hypothetical protein [Metaclostridioides mangenotii]|uniref:hypothetical protein n=1 Tax=Metaclostridioides mangenotii TaxID=1540 RepID=UPI0004BB0999|nr:hypothetical protein [Clostridioides mangenotii]
MNKRISREYLSNPFSLETRDERLKKSGAIDIRDNSYVVNLGNGYSKIVVIDKNKLL